MLPRLTPAVKFILFLTTGVFFLELIPGSREFIGQWLPLYPSYVLHHGWIWQLITYMLVHDPTNPMHIVFNMLTLYFFGGAVESAWGSRRFVWFYVICGMGAAICAVIMDSGVVIGASGGVFGVMVAYAMLFPDTVVLFFGIIPMRALHLVILLIAVEIVLLLGPGTGISNWAHLGGALTGYLYVKFSWRIGNWWKATFHARRRGHPGAPTPLASRRPGRSVPRSTRGTGSSGQIASVTSMPFSRASGIVSSPEEAAIQRRADEILDKISRDGMGSLTREEREILHKHSQILKAREGDVVKLDDYRS